jgi:predicted unusual protein kinase regulating ubiquinone biosynthesis (AarF/ABC1/UbiB family)
LYPNESSEHRIVMEKLEGIPIHELTHEQKEKCVTWLSKMVIQSIVRYGFMHADLHSGNIMFNDTYIGIIDFGYMITITKEEVDLLSHLFKDFAMEQFSSAADHLMNFISPLDQLTVDEIDDVKDFAIHIYQKSTDVDKKFSIYDILQIIKKIRMYHLKISPTFYAIGMAMTSIESVLHHLSSSSTDFMINAIIEILSLQIENRERQENGE